MPYVKTKFEDSTNGNIRFDFSTFDYTYIEDTFPEDSLNDFDSILLEHGYIFYMIQQTTTEDSYGEITDVTESSFPIHAIIQDIGKKDRKIHEMGLAVPGNRKMFLKPSYDLVSGTTTTSYVIKEGDILRDRNNYRWRVEKIISEHYLNNTEIFRTAVVRSIGLEGSG